MDMPYPITLPKLAKGLSEPDVLSIPAATARCLSGGTMALGESFFSQLENAVAGLGSIFLGTSRKIRHSARNPCIKSRLNHSWHRALGIRSIRFRMIASRTIRVSNCRVMRYPLRGLFVAMLRVGACHRVIGIDRAHTSGNLRFSCDRFWQGR